jgi:hypothetical protein
MFVPPASLTSRLNAVPCRVGRTSKNGHATTIGAQRFVTTKVGARPRCVSVSRAACLSGTHGNTRGISVTNTPTQPVSVPSTLGNTAKAAPRIAPGRRVTQINRQTTHRPRAFLGVGEGLSTLAWPLVQPNHHWAVWAAILCASTFGLWGNKQRWGARVGGASLLSTLFALVLANTGMYGLGAFPNPASLFAHTRLTFFFPKPRRHPKPRPRVRRGHRVSVTTGGTAAAANRGLKKGHYLHRPRALVFLGGRARHHDRLGFGVHHLPHGACVFPTQLIP